MAARVRRFFVDADVDQVDEGFEQLFHLHDELLVRERDGRLRRQRLDEALVGVGERADLVRVPVLRVDQLEHADQLPLVVRHRHGQDRLGPVAERLVERTHAREIEDVGLVHVGDVHGLVEVGRIGRHRGQVLVAVLVVQRDRRQVDRVAAGTALVEFQRVVQRNVEAQAALVAARAVQRAAVRVRHALGDLQDAVEEGSDIVAVAEGDADLREQVEPLYDIGRGELLHDRLCLAEIRRAMNAIILPD